jgi:hypothetical protein
MECETEMKNPIDVVQELGFDLAFLPNDYNASRINFNQKCIEIGTETQKTDIFDFPFICIAHEAGHALDGKLSIEGRVYSEIKAWKTAFEEFLTFQPEIRLRILREVQWHVNRYVQAYIFAQYPEGDVKDESW